MSITVDLLQNFCSVSRQQLTATRMKQDENAPLIDSILLS